MSHDHSNEPENQNHSACWTTASREPLHAQTFFEPSLAFAIFLGAIGSGLHLKKQRSIAISSRQPGQVFKVGGDVTRRT